MSAISPADGATNVSISTDVTITFSEPVNVTNPWFTINCGTSLGHTAVVTGGPTTFTLNPDADFANSETCTVTVDDQAVSDQDSDDPPDTMLADFSASFTTVAPPTADDAPAVSSTTPANGATGVADQCRRFDHVQRARQRHRLVVLDLVRVVRSPRPRRPPAAQRPSRSIPVSTSPSASCAPRPSRQPR